MEYSTTTQDALKQRRRQAALRRQKQVRRQRICLVALLLFAGAGIIYQGKSEKQPSKEEVIVFNIEEYPESLQALYENNPEARTFVKDYKTEAGKEHTIDLSEEVSKSSIPAFLQWDERWGYETYGSDMLAITGCGPTCLSMVLCGLTKDAAWSPIKVAKFAEENGFYEAGNGSKWSLMSEGAEQLGLTSEELPLDEARIKNELREGNPIICTMGPGDFTTSGHYIVLRGITKEGQILINDPNSKKRSKQKWNLDEIVGQIKNLWVYHV